MKAATTWAASAKALGARLQVGDSGMGGGVGVYGHNNGGISSGDRVSAVINHAPWFWPHQGTSTQETGTLETEWYRTHQRG